MADTKISALTALAGSSVDTAADVLAIVDTSVTTTKKIVVDELRVALGIATQAQQETGTSLVVNVTPGTQQFHQSSLKGWGLFNTVGGVIASFNVTSISDAGTGIVDVTWGTDFSSASYVVGGTAQDDNGKMVTVNNSSAPTAGTTRFVCFNTAGAASDPNLYHVWAAGDQ